MNKRLIFKIYKQFIYLTSKKNVIKQMDRRLE